MKPPQFDYRRVGTVDEAVMLLSDEGNDAKLLAGGQSLLPMMNLRLARPALLVDIGDLPAAEIAVEDAHLTLGCLVRHRQLEYDGAVRRAAPLFAMCAGYIGHPAIRSRGTIGGSLAHADPTAELALVSVAAGAEMSIVGARGARVMDAEKFFTGPFMTDLQPDEMLRAVRIPIATAQHRQGFREFAERHGDFALAAVACQLTMDGERVAQARVAVVGGALHPVRLPAVEDALGGARPSDVPFEEIAGDGTAGVEISDDPRISADYRRRLLRTLVADALRDATGNADNSQEVAR